MRLLPEDLYDNVSVDPLKMKKTNRLSQEKSPYLLQHASNPVNWYPWGEEAFEKARKEDKPIFLSIGYSTCYWCHVMEREVFENQSIADLMNLMVVSIKVDREERPDIDQIYMTALQAMTGNGGWPMSIFMTPDRKPFFAATYIPPDTRYGRTGFSELLQSIYRVWTNRRSTVLESGKKIYDFLIETATPPANNIPVTEQMLTDCFNHFEKSFDETYGGFSDAPKFPRPSIFNFLFRYYHRTGNCTARDMALTTLQNMAEGGMYDQLGGGFHRYSTDERWHVPHFEKMLYDQAQLIQSYLEAFQISHDPFFAQIAREVLAYVERSLMSPGGGFYSAEDAESALLALYPDKKKEGAFYVWKKSEIDRVLNEKSAKIIEFIYGIKEQENVLSDPGREFLGENVLYIAHSVEETAHSLHENIEDVQVHFDIARKELFEKRDQRPKPYLDDKILLSWNGLMISAFARASQVLKNKSYLDEASKAARFLLTVLTEPGTGRLLRRYRDGEAKFEAHLADYAFLIQGLLDLYEASFEIEWLRTAVKLTEEQNGSFYDRDNGGFYDVSGNDPTILVRTKEVYDNAEPSGNAIAILNLLRLSQMLGNKQYHEMVLKSITCFSHYIERTPQVLPQFLVAVDFNFSRPIQIVLAGNKENPVLCEMLNEIHSRFLPNKIVLLADGSEGQEFLSKHVPFFRTLVMVDGQQKIYVCENYTCELPISDLQTMIQILDRKLKK
jgi:Highly conserved protein containing a thioredoxin domain